MDEITRENVLDLLTEDWAQYVARYQSLPAVAQAAFLEQQGYKRLADLLAHIVAWWQVGLESIRRFRSDPTAKPLEIEIDSFNAMAVEQASQVSDAGEIKVFEQVRLQFVELIRQLSEADFKDERILTQIRWELVNHLEDHRIR
jgi:hypothetical protein